MDLVMWFNSQQVNAKCFALIGPHLRTSVAHLPHYKPPSSHHRERACQEVGVGVQAVEGHQRAPLLRDALKDSGSIGGMGEMICHTHVHETGAMPGAPQSRVRQLRATSTSQPGFHSHPTHRWQLPTERVVRR